MPPAVLPDLRRRDIVRDRAVQPHRHVLLYHAQDLHPATDPRVALHREGAGPQIERRERRQLGRDHVERHVQPQRPVRRGLTSSRPALSDGSAAVVEGGCGVAKPEGRHVGVLDGDVREEGHVHVLAEAAVDELRGGDDGDPVHPDCRVLDPKDCQPEPTLSKLITQQRCH